MQTPDSAIESEETRENLRIMLEKLEPGRGLTHIDYDGNVYETGGEGLTPETLSAFEHYHARYVVHFDGGCGVDDILCFHALGNAQEFAAQNDGAWIYDMIEEKRI